MIDDSGTPPDRDLLLKALRDLHGELGRAPSKAEFKSRTGLSEYQVLRHFDRYNDAVEAAGLEPHTANRRLGDEDLLCDWGRVTRELGGIPTRTQYRRMGRFSPQVFEKHFGPWSEIPARFSAFAVSKDEWSDVAALLPVLSPPIGGQSSDFVAPDDMSAPSVSCATGARHDRVSSLPSYGAPIDFRGLRHAPVNEQGVVFLFGMVARELGYWIEAVQAGFPDCEAKRQVDASTWQRVRIEFEYASRNFRDHGHRAADCDVVVCWRHNWDDCPPNLEVIELSSLINTLGKSDG